MKLLFNQIPRKLSFPLSFSTRAITKLFSPTFLVCSLNHTHNLFFLFLFCLPLRRPDNVVFNYCLFFKFTRYILLLYSTLPLLYLYPLPLLLLYLFFTSTLPLLYFYFTSTPTLLTQSDPKKSPCYKDGGNS